MAAVLLCTSCDDYLDVSSPSKFDRDYVEDIVQKFLDRKYSRNGDGGLFTVNRSRYDLRSVEIWYQMCWYLDENT